MGMNILENAAMLSVVIPTYNEVENIGPLVDLIYDELAGIDIEILVVDDNSPDGTSDAVRESQKKHAALRLVLRTEDPGLVQSIQAGIDAAQGEGVVWMDADFTMHPGYLRAFLSEIGKGADVVIGSRYVAGGGIKGAGKDGGRNTFRQFLENVFESEDSLLAIMVSLFGNFVIRHLFNPQYRDYTSGFYAVRRPLLRTLRLKGKYLDYCISFLVEAYRADLAISEIPVVMSTRAKGVSKTALTVNSLAWAAWHCFKTILRLTFRR